MASKPGSNSPSSSKPAPNQGLSNTEAFNSALSGASDRPVIPHLRHDQLPKSRPVPRSLQDYRTVEGTKEREARLKALWHRLPKKVDTDAGRYNQEEDAITRANLESIHSNIKHQHLTRENAETLRDMYQDELRDKHRVVNWDTFLAYADQKEVELWSIFHEQLDLDGNGHLDALELRAALSKAGIAMTTSTLSDFMSFLTSSPHSQAVSFPEFRDFLLLMPRTASTREIYRYYEVRKFLGDDGHGVARVNMEGDVSLSAEDRHPRHKAHGHGVHHLPTLDDGQPNEQSEDDGEDYYYDDDDDEELEEEDPHASFFVMVGHSQAFKFLLAGGIAGAVSRTATAPFDRLKVFLITHQIEPLSAAGGTAASNAAKQTTHGVKLLAHAIARIYAERGLRAFWVGNGLNVVKIFPESAIKFLSYEYAKRVFAKHWDKVDDPRQISGTSRFLSGGLGGIASQFSIYPLETLKTQMMSSSGERRDSLISCVKRTWALGGTRAYYRGLTIGLIGVFPYSAIDMSTFEALKLAYSRSTGNQEPGVLALLAFGSVSGTVGATSVYPLNLVRTRLQASGSPGHPQRYSGMAEVVKATMEKEGWRGFYRGLVPTLAKVIPAVSISYVVYETSKRKLGV